MITSLTEEQRGLLKVYADKWKAIGLSTKKCDRKEAEKWAKEAYKIAGLKPPKKFLWYNCPTSCALGQLEYSGEKDKSKFGSMVSDQVYGCHDAYWLGFYQYFLEVLNLKCCEKLIPLMKLAENCGWWAPYEDVCFMQEKPLKIHFNADRKLHNPNGPAITYRGGKTKVFSLNGTRMPAWVIETPVDELDAEKVLAIKNAEQRLQAIRHYGLQRFLDKLDTKVIDKEDEYELLNVKLNNEYRPFLKMINPSTNEIHVEGVPPGTKTVESALCWRLDFNKYNAPIVKT